MIQRVKNGYFVNLNTPAVKAVQTNEREKTWIVDRARQKRVESFRVQKERFLEFPSSKGTANRCSLLIWRVSLALNPRQSNVFLNLIV